MKHPVISVVMPVYNGEKYLREAIDSILNQTYTDFEFIILNDGSTDNTEKIILSYSDPRILYIKNDVNAGIVKTLNRGIGLAKGAYIARMDCDDISVPCRFEKQVEFFRSHADIYVCGTWIKLFNSVERSFCYPTRHEDIKSGLLFNPCMAHSSLMIKKNVFDYSRYDEKYDKIEDYALWLDLADNFKFANIPLFLLKYRIHCSQTNPAQQTARADCLRRTFLRAKFGCILAEDEIANVNQVANKRYLPIDRALQTFKNIEKANGIKRVFDKKALRILLSKRIISLWFHWGSKNKCPLGTVLQALFFSPAAVVLQGIAGRFLLLRAEYFYHFRSRL